MVSGPDASMLPSRRIAGFNLGIEYSFLFERDNNLIIEAKSLVNTCFPDLSPLSMLIMAGICPLCKKVCLTAIKLITKLKWQ